MSRYGNPLAVSFVIAAMLLVLRAVSGDAQQDPRSPQIHHIHGLAIDRTNPEILVVATHTGLIRLRPGATPEWMGEHRFDLMGFTPDPKATAVMYASGHPDLATYKRDGVGNLGLIMSRDGGRTWRPMALHNQADFHALTYSPAAGGQLYGWSVTGQVGLHRISTTTWAAVSVPARGLSDVLSLAASSDPAAPLLAGTKDGLRASRDGGATWSAVPAFPTSDAVTAVIYHASKARRAFAYGHPRSGLRRTDDAAATWRPTGFAAASGDAIVALAAGPGDHVAAATTSNEILRSPDGGNTWTVILGRSAGHQR